MSLIPNRTATIALILSIIFGCAPRALKSNRVLSPPKPKESSLEKKTIKIRHALRRLKLLESSFRPTIANLADLASLVKETLPKQNEVQHLASGLLDSLILLREGIKEAQDGRIQPLVESGIEKGWRVELGDTFGTELSPIDCKNVPIRTSSRFLGDPQKAINFEEIPNEEMTIEIWDCDEKKLLTLATVAITVDSTPDSGESLKVTLNPGHPFLRKYKILEKEASQSTLCSLEHSNGYSIFSCQPFQMSTTDDSGTIYIAKIYRLRLSNSNEGSHFEAVGNFSDSNSKPIVYQFQNVLLTLPKTVDCDYTANFQSEEYDTIEGDNVSPDTILKRCHMDKPIMLSSEER